MEEDFSVIWIDCNIIMIKLVSNVFVEPSLMWELSADKDGVVRPTGLTLDYENCPPERRGWQDLLISCIEYQLLQS